MAQHAMCSLFLGILKQTHKKIQLVFCIFCGKYYKQTNLYTRDEFFFMSQKGVVKMIKERGKYFLKRTNIQYTHTL